MVKVMSKMHLGITKWIVKEYIPGKLKREKLNNGK